MLAIIMRHGEVQGIDAAEIFGIERMLAADLRARLGIEIGRQAADDRIEDRDAGNGQFGAALLELAAQIDVDDA